MCSILSFCPSARLSRHERHSEGPDKGLWLARGLSLEQAQLQVGTGIPQRVACSLPLPSQGPSGALRLSPT